MSQEPSQTAIEYVPSACLAYYRWLLFSAIIHFSRHLIFKCKGNRYGKYLWFSNMIFFSMAWNLIHCEKNVFIEKNHLSRISYLASEIFIKTINTKYMTIPTIVSPVKMEYGWNFSISRLKMTLKSGFDFFLNSSMSSPCHFNYCTLCFWSKFLLSMR